MDGGESSPREGIAFEDLEKGGREGKWYHVIGCDVARTFGNMETCHHTGPELGSARTLLCMPWSLGGRGE